MSYLLCARCGVPLFDDPHTDTDLEDVCGGCCRVCNPFSDSPWDSGTSDGEVGQLPTSPIPGDGLGPSRPPAGLVASHSTNEVAPAVVCSDDAGA